MFLIKILISFLLMRTILPSISVDAQTPGCGGTYSDLSGTISSPNYPSNYVNDIDCVYYIQVPPPNYVNITFMSFETQSSVDWLQVACSSDSIIPVRTFTGSALPSPLSIPPCSNVSLRFHTDGSVVYQGFNLTYNIYTGCGGTYSNDSGIISSPNYPSNYSNNLNCTYYIQSSQPDSVNITFLSFATEFYYDWLKISCANDSTKPVQRFSGSDLPPFLSISSCDNVQLVFYTDVIQVANGFSLRYDIGNGLQGGLTMKPMNLNVRSDSTQPIVLSCSSRANQPDVYPWWSYNRSQYVEILTTSNCSVSSSLWLLTSSYFSTTRQYPSRTCNLTISMSYFPAATGKYTCTDSTLDFSNALVTFVVIPQSCSGIYTDRSGIIYSPNYPSNYNSNLNCTYYIQSSPPDSVNITFISFATEFYYDWLQVTCTNDSTKPVQRFSGTNLPPFLSISSCNNVQLLFHTDGSDVAKGFSLRYDIGNGLQGGLTMRPMNLNVRSDSTEPIVLSCSSRANQPDVYPWWSYVTNDNPYVEILTTSNCSVSTSLEFLISSYFSTTRQYPSRTCNLTISRSYFPAATGKYTCTDSTLDFSNAMVTFVGCGGTYTDRSGIISSSNYPSNYNSNLNCTYFIQSSPPDSVNITFISFATEFYHDWLQVSCVSDSTKPVQRFSGTNLPPFLSISSCNNVQLVFHTDGSVVRQGFSLRYDIGNGSQGGLTMKPVNLHVRTDSTEPIVLSCSSRANQPDVYPWWSYVSNDNPYVEILTTSNCSVSSSLRNLNSEYFNTTRQYSSRTCNLTISRSSFPSATGKYTCTDATLDFSNALVTFGGCGGTYTDRSGIISSSNYPYNYNHNMDCTYYIQSSPPDSVNITFISFATEFYYDWLQVTCTNDSTKPVQRFSGTNLPPFLSISSCYNVQLLFHTDSYGVAQGFSLRYDIGNGLEGGLLMKPMNAYVRNDSTQPIVLSCSSRANQPDVYPWWSYISNDYPYVQILTTSNCSVSSSLRLLTSSYFNTTKQYSSRTCNLTISRSSFPSAIGKYTCTDSTLDFFKALVILVVPTFEFVNLNSSTEVVRNDQISVTCSVQVFQATSSILQLVPSIYLYSSDNPYPIMVSNSTVSFNLSASPEILPSYGCDINFSYSSNFSAGYATNKPQGISFMTQGRQVLYWPEDKAILIQGDNSGKVAANGNLTCFVPANPNATYQWTNEEFFNLWKGPTVAVSRNGTYTCTATNIIRGKTYEASKSINITVIEGHQPLSSTAKNEPEDKLNSVALAVGVVLGIAVLLLVVTIVLLICLRRKKNPNTNPDSGDIVAAAAATNEGLETDFFEMK